MLRIRDLPRGGAVAAGRSMWFEVLADDGRVYAFSLASEQVEAFIAGLRTFQLEAAALAARSGRDAGWEPAFLQAARFAVAVGGEGELRLTLGAPGAGEVRAAVPRERVKGFLSAVLGALAGSAPPPPAAKAQ